MLISSLVFLTEVIWILRPCQIESVNAKIKVMKNVQWFMALITVQFILEASSANLQKRLLFIHTLISQSVQGGYFFFINRETSIIFIEKIPSNVGINSKVQCRVRSRAVGRSENPGVPVVIRWALSVPLVEIGLNDLPKSGCGTPRHPQGRHLCVLDLNFRLYMDFTFFTFLPMNREPTKIGHNFRKQNSLTTIMSKSVSCSPSFNIKRKKNS